MKGNIKRSLGLLLAAFMVFALIPNTSQAADINVSGEVNASAIPDGAGLNLTGNTTINVDADKTLEHINGSHRLTIVGNASHTLTVNNRSGTAISVSVVEIAANVTAITGSASGPAIYASGGSGGNSSIIISSGKVRAEAKKDAIHAANAGIRISGGSVRVESANNGIVAASSISIGQNATVNVRNTRGKGIFSQNSAVYLNGSVTVGSGGYGVSAGTGIEIRGGNHDIIGSPAALIANTAGVSGSRITILPASGVEILLPKGGSITPSGTTIITSYGMIARHVIIGRDVSYYSISVTGGTAYVKYGTPDQAEVTRAEAGTSICVIPDLSEGKYVKKWMSEQVEHEDDRPVLDFTMPAKDVILVPEYADQTPYTIDLQTGAASVDRDAFWALVHIYLKTPSIIGDTEYPIDLDGDGTNDIVIQSLIDTYKVSKASDPSIDVEYTVTSQNIWKYRPITVKFTELKYSVSVTGGTAHFDLNGPAITESAAGKLIMIKTTPVVGKYVTSWLAPDAVGFIGGYLPSHAQFIMPAQNVSLTAQYSDQTPYYADLRSGAAVAVPRGVFWAIMTEYTDIGNVSNGDVIKIDLNDDGSEDISLSYSLGTLYIRMLDSSSIVGDLTLTNPNLYLHYPITLGFYTPLELGVCVVPNGTVGESYSGSIGLVEGTGLAPFEFEIVEGSLPRGLTLNAETGVIEGVPTSPGTFTFTVRVTDDRNYYVYREFEVTIRSSHSHVEEPIYPIEVGLAPGGTVESDVSAAAEGATVTLTAAPAEGYVLDTITVTDPAGRSIRLIPTADGTFLFTMPASRVSVSAVFKKTGEAHICPSKPYTDVNTDLWYHESIDFVIENGLMKGVGPTLFEPDSPTTRAMIVTILYRLEGSPEVSGTSPYSDVTAGRWFTDAVIWADKNGIVYGYGNGAFGPEDRVTREQMAAILYRYARFKGYDTGKAADLSGYLDCGAVSPWALTAMRWANAEGLIVGRSGILLAPGGNATRAETAAMIMRFVKNIK